MNYFKRILSALAALFLAELVFQWPLLSTSKATGMDARKALLLASFFSPRFWIVGLLLFGLFYTASRGGPVLRVTLFWIPTIAVSALGIAYIALCICLVTVARRQ